MTNEQLLFVAKVLRNHAAPFGPLHGLWDLITDAEQHGKGSSAFILDRETLVRALEREIKKRGINVR